MTTIGEKIREDHAAGLTTRQIANKHQIHESAVVFALYNNVRIAEKDASSNNEGES